MTILGTPFETGDRSKAVAGVRDKAGLPASWRRRLAFVVPQWEQP